MGNQNTISKIAENIKIMKKNWDIIRQFNIYDKGRKPDFDLKKIYESNLKLEKEIVELKLDSLAFNLGLKSRDELPKNNAYTTIYILSQLKSKRDNLKTIKANKDKDQEVVFDYKTIREEINRISKEILRLENELTLFNNK